MYYAGRICLFIAKRSVACFPSLPHSHWLVFRNSGPGNLVNALTQSVFSPSKTFASCIRINAPRSCFSQCAPCILVLCARCVLKISSPYNYVKHSRRPSGRIVRVFLPKCYCISKESTIACECEKCDAYHDARLKFSNKGALVARRKAILIFASF